MLDINLGAGSSSKLAKMLKDRNIPFVFMNSYDVEAIPVEFEGVEQLAKTLYVGRIVGEVAKMATAAN